MANQIDRLTRLLETLAPADRPGAALQIVSAAAPFEPNPLVPTVVAIPAVPNDWSRLSATLRLVFPLGQDVWLLRTGRGPERRTLGSVLDWQSDWTDGALYVPAVAAPAAERSLHGLRSLVHRLRAPGGCPWDREQTPESLVRYVLEEAYEVADAIQHHGSAERAEELGDLLLQVFLQAEIAEEAGDFDLNDVVEQISRKLIRRHPHVFGDVVVANAAEVERNWERLKGAEKAERSSTLDGIPRSLPALQAALEIQKRLKKAGFDWPDRGGVDAKLEEELAELRAAPTPDEAADELGDVLFILTRLGLEVGANAEEALRGTNARVAARFGFVEDRLRERGLTFKDVPLEESLALWSEAKAAAS